MDESENCDFSQLADTGRRLEGVQGPEQGLVGDVAKRIPRQGHAEAAQPGERGVGEIVELPELRRHVARMIREARQQIPCVVMPGWNAGEKDFWLGEIAALVELVKRIERRPDKRSDLSNAATHAPGANEKPLK